MYPETWSGKLVASILVFVSMVYLALPMTIIVSKFNKAFEKFKPADEKEGKGYQQGGPPQGGTPNKDNYEPITEKENSVAISPS